MKSILTLILLFLTTILIGQSRIFVNASALGQNDGSSWANAFKDLQPALAAAVPGDEIWVAQGTYFPTLYTNRDSSFNLPSGVRLYGGFRGIETDLNQRDWAMYPTILSGDIGVAGDSTDNSYTILYLDNPDSTTVVDGIVFRFGNAGYTGNDQLAISRFRSGGAIYILADWEAFVMISNCRFEYNSALSHGGAVCVNGTGSFATAPTIRDCVFERNNAGQDGGGVARIGNSNLERSDFVRCAFQKNQAGRYGGGLYYADTDVSSMIDITGCTFIQNSSLNKGGAAALRLGRVLGAKVKMESCRFEGNETPDLSGALSLLNLGAKPFQMIELRDCFFKNNQGYEIDYDVHGTPTSTFTLWGCSFYDHFSTNSIISGDYIFELIIEKDTFVNVPNARIVQQSQEKSAFRNCVFKNVTTLSRFQHSGEAICTNSLFLNCNFPTGIVVIGTEELTMFFASCSFVDCSTNCLVGHENVSSTVSAFFDNCLFSRCSITYSIDCRKTVVNLDHCTFDSISVCEPDITNVTTNCGPNNLYGINPLFRDTTNGDYSLLPCSPLINAGSNAAAAGILTDLAGNPRIQGGTVDIGAYESPAFALSGTPQVQPACLGASNGSISLQPENGCAPLVYQWSPNVGSGPELDSLAPGLYVLTLTDGRGQQITNQFVVETAPSPALALVPTDVLCGAQAGGTLSASVQGGTAPFEYLWSPAAEDTPLLTQQQPGAYALTIVDANGCQDSATAAIALMGQITLTIGGQIIPCHGETGWLSATPSTGAAPFFWHWDGWPGTDPVAEPLGPGQYSVTVTDAYGCTAANTYPPMIEPGPLSVGTGSSDQTQNNPPNGAAVVTTISGGTGPSAISGSPAAAPRSPSQVWWQGPIR